MSENIIRCPNENCDENEGCCLCEYTGWIDLNLFPMIVSDKEITPQGQKEG